MNRNNDEAYANFNWDKLGFGLTPTDYIYIMKISGKDNFSEGSLSRYGNIEISPSAAIFNYGQVIFLVSLLGMQANFINIKIDSDFLATY